MLLIRVYGWKVVFLPVFAAHISATAIAVRRLGLVSVFHVMCVCVEAPMSEQTASLGADLIGVKGYGQVRADARPVSYSPRGTDSTGRSWCPRYSVALGPRGVTQP